MQLRRSAVHCLHFRGFAARAQTGRARRLLLAALLSAATAVTPLAAQNRTLEFHAFTVLAGQAGITGNVDGTGSGARLNYPNGLALDSTGNLYLAAGDNHTIRKITPDGTVSTLAGRAGFSGTADGLGSAARFDQPTDLVLDSAGNLYVTDFSHHAIRKETPAGPVSTFAGLAGSTGSTDGTGSATRFFDPNGLCIDTAGNLFVADRWNNLVCKVTPAGVVTTVAGTARSSGTSTPSEPRRGSAARRTSRSTAPAIPASKYPPVRRAESRRK
jgi:hypothetical protein